MAVDTVYKEFVDSNLDKRYPLSDYGGSSDEFDIPSSFLADIKLFISKSDIPGDGSYVFTTYISSIRVYPDYIYVEISTESDGVVAISDPISTLLDLGSSIEDRTIAIRSVSDYPVIGKLIVGYCGDINKYPGVWDISKDNGRIFPANITVIPDQLNSIIVGDRKITGDIILEAGEGIDINYDESTNTIVIEAAGQGSSDNSGPMDLDEEDVIAAITKKYGKPITTINGVNNNGTVTIGATDCFVLTTTENGISFYNPCGPSCSSEDFMSDTYDRISDLNNSSRLITELYNSLSSSISQMLVRLSALLESRKK